MKNSGDEIAEEYRSKTNNSEELYRKACEILPEGIGGSSPPYSPYPFFVEKAEGAKMWDVDGNEFLDFNLCWGVLMVGHSHPKLVEGLSEQLERGTMYGMPHEETREAAEEIVRRFPVDMVRFTNSGSESTLYSVRMARRYTGREKIIKIEGAYDGVYDPLHISKMPPVDQIGPRERPVGVPHGGGITAETLKDTLIAPFNDIQVMEDLLDEHGEETAAVIVEPVMMNKGVIPPDDGYLKELRKLTEEHDVLLIFDEVKTGVKIAPGGASEYYDIEPDLIALAKAIGGGLPIGACAGRREVMEEIADEGLFGTYSANPLSVRACKITLTDILTDSAYDRLSELGEELMDGYRDIVEDNEIDAVVQGINAVGGILFTGQEVRDFRDWTTVDEDTAHKYWLSMVNEGIVPMSYGADEEWLISVQHDDEDIEYHLEKFKEVGPSLR
ncbi:MAG: aminotransferase class III-fold pyridoxal phosphate-dependent enzyme [Thermoplasmata archaeon]